MTNKKIALVTAVLAFFAACRTGSVDGDDDVVMPTYDAAMPPPPAVDAGTPPPAQPGVEECVELGQLGRAGCGACPASYWECIAFPEGRIDWDCNQSACVLPDAATPPPPPVEDAGMMPESDAGTPPPPPAMEDAGTPPPVDLCAGQLPRACSVVCEGVGVEICDPATGVYGDCDVVVALPCADAGTPPPPADAGPAPCTPSVEVCDGIDNDCDGETDEASPGVLLVQTCTGGSGRCALGLQFCNGGEWSPCENAFDPIDEICSNGLDDDCDGSTDDGCTPPPSTCSSALIGTACNNGRAFSCRRDGLYVCSTGGVLICSAPDVAPTTEICGDSIDQDCSGGDLACSPPPTTDIWVAYQMKVSVESWGTTNTYRLRNGSWWGDPNVIRCENTGSSEWEAIGDGWFECVARRVDPFNLSFLSTSPSHSGDLAAVIEAGSPATCQLTGGIQLRIFETNNVSDSRAAGAHYRNLIPGGSPSPLRVDGVCRLDLTT